MKRKLITTTALLVGLFAVTLPARADRLGFQIGVAGGNGYFRVGYDSGRGHGKHSRYKKEHRQEKHSKYDRRDRYRRHRHSRRVRFGTPIRQHVRQGHRPAVHTCIKRPVYKDVWVPPVYRKAFDGRDPCGRPRYRSVLVKPGYYRTVVSHYACGCARRH